jgi:hypothetical protein
MSILSFLILFFGLAAAGVYAAEAAVKAPPEVEWEYTYGGNGYDELNSLRGTSDGGYIIAGGSGSTGDGVTDHHGDEYWLYDYWIVKLDALGGREWAKSFGGAAYDSAVDVLESKSGGYIVTGYTQSSDDVVGPNKGRNDAWVLKLSDGGESVWTGARSLGGKGIDSLVSIAETPEEYAYQAGGSARGTYVLLGQSATDDNNPSLTDIWLYKLYDDNDKHGLVWQKTYAKPDTIETARKILNAPGAGYIVTGVTEDRSIGNTKSWIFKIDEDGDIVWEKTLGGGGENEKSSLRSILFTPDGGFIVAGEKSGGGAPYDYWVAKLNANRGVEWERTYGSAASDDIAWDIAEARDGGYIVVGSSESDYLGASNHGDYDALIIKIDADGEPEWSMSLGGSDYDEAVSIYQASDGGHVIGGMLGSADGNVPSNEGDYWVVKLAPEASGKAVVEASEGAPAIEWNHLYGGPGYDVFRAARQTGDGGYLFTAEGGPSGGDIDDHMGADWTRDYWVVKLGADGLKQWARSYGGEGFDSAMNFVESRSGGYVVTGFTQSSNEGVGTNWGRNDAWVVKLDGGGDVAWTGARSFGGTGYDTLVSIVETPEEYAHAADGVKRETYVLSGGMSSNVISVDNGSRILEMRQSGSIRSEDIWVHKLYEYGDHHPDQHRTVWSKAFYTDDPNAYEISHSILSVPGGGYVVGGTVNESGSDVGASELWIFKLDEDGEKVWESKIGKGGFYFFGSLKATSDGGFIATGSKAEAEEADHEHDHGGGGDGGHNHDDAERNFDFWTVKLNGSGEVEWERTYGIEGVIEYARDVAETADGGYIVVGGAEPEETGLANQEAGKTASERDEDLDARIVKFDANGEAEWFISLGGSSFEEAKSIHRTGDGGYIVGGNTSSGDWDTEEGAGKGDGDCWIIKLAPEASTPPNDDDPGADGTTPPADGGETGETGEKSGSGGCDASAAAMLAAVCAIVLRRARGKGLI